MLEKFLTESINDRGIFKAIFMAGVPGSGKSFTSTKIVDGAIQPRIVNTDKFFEYFLFNDGGLDLDILDRSKILTKKQLFFYLNGMLPLLIDTTSSSVINLIRRKAMLESIGYDCGLVWIDTDLEIALERNRERNRVVDEDFIHRSHESIKKNINYIKTHFDFYKKIENNHEMMDNEVIKDAYKKVKSFYQGDVKNPIGIKNTASLLEMGDHYLTPNIYSHEELIKDMEIWYRRSI